MLLLIQVLFTVLNLIEAKLESIVIALKDPTLPNYPSLDKQEHLWSAIYYCGVVGIVTLISYISNQWVLIPLLLANRRLFFQESLNVFRRKGLFYLSDKGLDGWMKRNLGKKAGIVNDLISIVIITVFNIIKF